ncbi:kinase-like domain-containing protein [Biscogniauxia marginata]|nr:kinase-like domain-containing protein [Biscogniauxia marginata]
MGENLAPSNGSSSNSKVPSFDEPVEWEITSTKVDTHLGVRNDNKPRDYRALMPKLYRRYNFPTQGGTKKKFVPRGVIERLSTESEIKTIIKDEALAKYVSRHLRTMFVISCHCSKEKTEECMAFAREKGYKDSSLPLSNDENSETLFGAFVNFEGPFCSPIFKKDEQLNLTLHWSVPIWLCGHIGSGCFSNVYKVKIHPDHDQLQEPTSQYYAMKSYNKVNGILSYDRESEFHAQLAGIKHENIVRPLTHWTYESSYYMLFPCADYNLEEYMKKKTIQLSSQQMVQWVLKQIWDLSGALRAFHDVKSATKELSGYHMDIKPENVLVFKSDNMKECYLGLSDFGCGKITALISRSQSGGGHRSHQTEHKMGNLTFQAPEAYPNKKCGRKADIWSMGAVFLEIMVWLLLGPNKLDKFRDKREGTVVPEPEIKDSRLFIMREGKALLRAAVDKMIRDIKAISSDYKLFAILITTVEKMLQLNANDRPDARKVFEDLSPLGNVTEQVCADTISDNITKMRIYDSWDPAIDGSSEGESHDSGLVITVTEHIGVDGTRDLVVLGAGTNEGT